MPKHVFLFSGSSAVGKTSILRYLIPFLEKGGMRTAICKIDCLSSNDESVYKNLNIPTVTGLSRDICPDHFLVSNLPELWDWCDSLGRDCLLIETAGLCHRCSPATELCTAGCVLDCTASSHSPERLGPMRGAVVAVLGQNGKVTGQDFPCGRSRRIRDRIFRGLAFGAAGN